MGSVLNITTWEQIVERNGIVKINDYSEADEYTSDYALRVPKIVRFRPHKRIDEIDSIEKLHRLDEMQYERHPFQSL